MATDRWGIDDGYLDTFGQWRPTSDTTRRALLAAMGVGPDEGPPGDAEAVVVRQGDPLPEIAGPGDLVLEDGTTLLVDRAFPRDLPFGYHELRTRDGRCALVIVAPARCHEPPGRTWGWAAQLYAARSEGSWGIGDFADLGWLVRWTAALGGGAVIVNPLNASVPRELEDPSPYAPSSRRYLNPLYLRVEDVPGAATFGPDLGRLQAAGRALNAQRRIDREAVGRLKREALERLWPRFGGDPDFDDYVRAEGRALELFAVFSALAEHHRRPWQAWPDEHRHPARPGVARFAAERRERVRFHEWVQWLLDRQLARAALDAALVHDMPIGVDPDGADAWGWQDVLATGASAGAPPDGFNQRGQDWGLPPFVPHRLRAARYQPFVESLRGLMRHGGGVRIDHVLGLFRLFWVPRGLPPAEGGYVRYPADELLAILAVESHRARAIIVGEDLGTVEPGVRERLAGRSVLSTRVLWFETDPPERWPALALATASTHDLPTIAGVWDGSDLVAQRAIGLVPNADDHAAMRRHLGELTGVPENGPVERVIEEVYRVMGGAPSLVVTAMLEDALAVPERPNMPGTTDEWPNWRLALPRPIEALADAPLARAIADALGTRGVHSLPPGGADGRRDPR